MFVRIQEFGNEAGIRLFRDCIGTTRLGATLHRSWLIVFFPQKNLAFENLQVVGTVH